jgi:hypothetical protein
MGATIGKTAAQVNKLEKLLLRVSVSTFCCPGALSAAPAPASPDKPRGSYWSPSVHLSRTQRRSDNELVQTLGIRTGLGGNSSSGADLQSAWSVHFCTFPQYGRKAMVERISRQRLECGAFPLCRTALGKPSNTPLQRGVRGLTYLLNRFNGFSPDPETLGHFAPSFVYLVGSL